MRHSDAVDMVALVGKLWPGWRANESEDAAKATGKEWATELLPLERTDVETAIRLLGRLQKFPASLSEILDGAEECRRERIPSLPAIPSPADLIPPSDAEETKAILATYWATVGLERESRVRLATAAAHGDTNAKIEAARQVARTLLEADSDPVREGQAKPLREASDARATRSACGAAFGTPSVIRDGVAVCPRCGSPIAEGCGGFAAERGSVRDHVRFAVLGDRGARPRARTRRLGATLAGRERPVVPARAREALAGRAPVRRRARGRGRA